MAGPGLVNGELDLLSSARAASFASLMEVPLEIDVLEARRLLQSSGGAVLLDVREPYEVAIAQLPGSTFIPMREIPEKLAELPADRHLLVLCHGGVRSMQVTRFLRANGRPRVTNIAGGIDAWSEHCDSGVPRY